MKGGANMQFKIENLEEKVLSEFKSQLNPDAVQGSKDLTLAIATVAAKISSITAQKVCEELSEQIHQAAQQASEN